MISVALFGIALIAIMTVLTQRVAGTLSAASNDREYEDAMYAAEAGLDVGLSQLAVDPAFSTITTGIDLSSREAVILAAEQLAADPEQVVSTPSGDYVIVKRSDSDTVYAVGAAPSWTDGNRRVRVVEGTVEPLESEVCWPEGALIANGLLEWGGGAVMTVPSSAHAAHAIGNGSFKGSSGIFIDGDIRVAGEIFNTAQSNLYGTMETGANPLNFPSGAALATWQSELEMEALMGGGTIGTIDLSGPMTIDAPVRIDGDIFLRSGGHLTINGPGVVYVTGMVELGGDSVLENGSLLAVAGQFKQGGGTSYLLTGSVADSGLVSFLGGTTDAIIFEGAATGMQGVIYAARGGVKLTGPAALQGAAIAGGGPPYGQLKAGGATTVTYPAGLLPASAWLPEVTGGPGGGCGPGSNLWFPDAAIIANGQVVMSGGAITSSNPNGSGVAHVMTNSTFKDATAWIDGDLLAGSTATVDPTKVGGTVTQDMGVVWQFPPQTEVDAWQASLVELAQQGPTVGSVKVDSSGSLSAPLFIEGDLTISGVTLTLDGPGVIYVTGKVVASGGSRVINNGVVLASGLQMVFSGGSTYEVSSDPMGAGIVSFAQGVDKALELSGGSSGVAHGIAYAPNGGVKLTGSSAWLGALIGGGSGGKGKVELSGGSSVVFPTGLVSSTQFLPGHEDPEPVHVTLNLVRRREL